MLLEKFSLHSSFFLRPQKKVLIGGIFKNITKSNSSGCELRIIHLFSAYLHSRELITI